MVFFCRQICDAISILSTFYPDDKKQCHELVDKLWSGIMDKSREINVDTMAKVFNTLPHLKQVISFKRLFIMINKKKTVLNINLDFSESRHRSKAFGIQGRRFLAPLFDPRHPRNAPKHDGRSVRQ